MCKDNDGAGATVASGSGAGPLDVPVTNGAQIACTITNTRRTGQLRVVKSLAPATDPGRFDLRIDGTTYRTDAGNGDSTPAQTVNTGTHTVSETAGSSTTLSDYDSAIRCDNGTQGTGTSLQVTVADGATVTCTITNTRRPPPPGPPLTLAVTGDRCDPISAPDVDVTVNRPATGTLIVARQNGIGRVRRCPTPQPRSTVGPTFTQTLTRPVTLTQGTQVVTAARLRARARTGRPIVGPRRATFKIRLKPGRTRVRLGRIAGARLTSGRYEFCVAATDSAGNTRTRLPPLLDPRQPIERAPEGHPGHCHLRLAVALTPAPARSGSCSGCLRGPAASTAARS